MRNTLALLLLAGTAPCLAEQKQPFFLESIGDVSEVICKPNPSLEKICEKSNSECKMLTGDSLCNEFDLDRARVRANSRELRTRYFTKTYLKFQEIISDPENIRLCGEDFAKTKLEILDGLPANASVAHYQPQTNTVSLSHGRILNATTFEDIERGLYHELGHSCQFNKNKLLRDNYYCDESESKKILDEKITVAFRDFRGISTSQKCVKAHLYKTAGDRKSACLPSYVIEA